MKSLHIPWHRLKQMKSLHLMLGVREGDTRMRELAFGVRVRGMQGTEGEGNAKD